MLHLHQALEALCIDLNIDDRDRLTILNRLKNEGLSFVTKTLPAFAKAFVSGLETGRVDLNSTAMTAFAWHNGSPSFLKVYFKQVFTKSGVLRVDADPVSIMIVRQLCEYCYKLAVPFTAEQLDVAEKGFIITDDSLPATIPYEDEFLSGLRKWIGNKFQHTFNVTYERILANYRPRFGPGTFSCDGLSSRHSSEKYYVAKRKDCFTATLPLAFRGFEGYFKSYPSAPQKIHLSDSNDAASEVLFVPKDSRGPRTIVREPFHNLRGQMAFHDFLRGALEKVTRNRVNFLDQSYNQRLACTASVGGEWATLDLKEASDRVSYRLVRYLFDQFPCFKWFLDHFRTSTAILPSGRRKVLKKLSGMGSGFTFPIMSMMIYSAICYHLEKTTGRDCSDYVFVYGDDVIVPTRYASLAIEALEHVFLRVNTSKSFVSVPKPSKVKTARAVFRESCGADFFGGNNVTPVKLKLSSSSIVYQAGVLTPANESSFFLELERHCRELVKAQLFSLSEVFYKLLEKKFGKLPWVLDTSPALGRLVKELVYKTDAFGNVLNVRAMVPVSEVESVEDDSPYGYLHPVLSRLSRNFDALGSLMEPSPPREELGRCIVPRKIKLARRAVPTWTTSY